MSQAIEQASDRSQGAVASAPPPSLSFAAVGEVWRLAWPTVLTMTSYTVMQFMDKLMVAQVGPLEVAAQGNGGIWAFNVIAFVMGVLTVVNTFVAQNLGAGRPENGPRYAWAGAWLSAASWVALLLPFALVLPTIFGSMDHSPELVRLESVYGQILLVGAVVLLANKSIAHYFFGMHRPMVIAAAALVGNVANVSLNYVLIFGEAGLPSLGLPGIPGTPALGLAGAALATVIGTAIELAIPTAIFLGPKMNRLYRTRAAWRPDFGPMRELLRIGWPAAVQFGNEVVCWSLFMSVLVGAFGADQMTAGWAALAFMHLSFMPAIGFSVAVSSLVGRYIGAGEPDLAAGRARLGAGLATTYMTFCAVIFVLFREELIGAFVGGRDVVPEQAARIVAIGAQLMICAAVFQTVDALGVVYTGALRGAGDTVWPGVATIVLSWAFIVGLGGLLVVLAPQLEALGPWIGAAAYVIIYGIVMTLRFESGRWRSIRLVRPAKEATDEESARLAALAASVPASPLAADPAEDLVGDLAMLNEPVPAPSRGRRSGD